MHSSFRRLAALVGLAGLILPAFAPHAALAARSGQVGNVVDDRAGGKSFKPQYREITVNADGTLSFWGTTVRCGTLSYAGGSYEAIPVDETSSTAFRGADFAAAMPFDALAFYKAATSCGRKFAAQPVVVNQNGKTYRYASTAGAAGTSIWKADDGSTIQLSLQDRGLASVIAAGGANVIRIGGSVIAAGGANVIAAGGANVIAAGGANVIAAGGANLQLGPSAYVIAAGGANVIAAGGANLVSAPLLSLDGASLMASAAPVIAAGGANVIAAGGANVIAAGGANMTGGYGTLADDPKTVRGALDATQVKCAPGDAIVYVPASGGAKYYAVNPKLAPSGGAYACRADLEKHGLSFANAYWTGNAVASAPASRYVAAPPAATPASVAGCSPALTSGANVFVVHGSAGACGIPQSAIVAAQSYQDPQTLAYGWQLTLTGGVARFPHGQLMTFDYSDAAGHRYTGQPAESGVLLPVVAQIAKANAAGNAAAPAVAPAAPPMPGPTPANATAGVHVPSSLADCLSYDSQKVSPYNSVNFNLTNAHNCAVLATWIAGITPPSNWATGVFTVRLTNGASFQVPIAQLNQVAWRINNGAFHQFMVADLHGYPPKPGTMGDWPGGYSGPYNGATPSPATIPVAPNPNIITPGSAPAKSPTTRVITAAPVVPSAPRAVITPRPGGVPAAPGFTVPNPQLQRPRRPVRGVVWQPPASCVPMLPPSVPAQRVVTLTLAGGRTCRYDALALASVATPSDANGDFALRLESGAPVSIPYRELVAIAIDAPAPRTLQIAGIPFGQLAAYAGQINAMLSALHRGGALH